jgi:hypothetical protein
LVMMTPTRTVASVGRSTAIVGVLFVILTAIGALMGLHLSGPRQDELATEVPEALAVPTPRFADFGEYLASSDARHVADWIADSRDNAGFEFIIIDKKDARIYVFDGDARVRASAPVLLGAARGDESLPGIGSRPLSAVRQEERTTPAGRFVAERGRNTRGEDVIWVDYDAAVSMHRVRATNPREHRLERLATPTVLDNRISYGCINVPVDLYEAYVRPAFGPGHAIVYVLPEIKSVQEVFGTYDVASRRLAPHDS